jgi:protein SCO1
MTHTQRLAVSLAALCAALASGTPAHAQTTPASVGIEPRLGALVPLDLPLVDEAGQRITLQSLVDRPTILTLNYFRCAGICTPLLNGVANMIDQIALEPGKDFRVVTVSFDDRDTPEIAARKRENFLKLMKRPVPPTAWRFLTGEAASTKQLADAVGFRFQRSGEDFIHPGVIILLSPTGHVTRYILGTHFLPADVQMAVGEAARDLARPTIAQPQTVCYNADPAARGYAGGVLRIVSIVTLAVLAVFVVALRFAGRRRRGGEGQ